MKRFAVVPLLLLLGLACSKGPARVERSPGGYDHFQLKPVKKVAVDVTVRDIEKLEPFDEQEKWSALEECAMRFGKNEHVLSIPMTNAIWVWGPATGYVKGLRRSGEVNLTGVNQMDCWLSEPMFCRVTAEFRLAGAVVATSTVVDVPPSTIPSRVLLPIVRNNASVVRADEMIVRVHVMGAVEIGVRSIVLQSRPIAALAAARPDDELVFSDTDGRRGTILSTSRTLNALVSVGMDARLEFSYCTVPAPGSDASACQVELRITRDDGRVELSSYPIKLDANGVAPWHEESIPIKCTELETVQVEFSIATKAGAEPLVAIGDVAIYTPPKTLPPSVLLVTSDTHRSDFVAIAGEPSTLATPNLAALAARGVAFTNCWSSTNITNPSHIAIMTGASPRDSGVTNNRTRLADAAPTLAEGFRSLGYRTWAVVSVRHLRHDLSGLGQGFDRMDAPSSDERHAAQSVDIVENWLKSAMDQPVFLWLHVFDAHAPYNPPPEYSGMYWDATRDPKDPALADPGLPTEVLIAPDLVGVRDLNYPIAEYRGEISYLDAQLARVFDLPRFRDGIVGFVADHGESLGEHGIYYGHAGLYPQTLHVPLIVSWPGCPKGTLNKRPVQSTDIAKTFLELVGKDSTEFGGRDLRGKDPSENAPQVNPAPPQARFALGAHRTEASITLKQFHLILNLYEHKEDSQTQLRHAHEVELYDLANDPECTRNLVAEQPDVAKQLYHLLTEWCSVPPAHAWAGTTSNDPEVLSELARLGYASTAASSAEPLWKFDDCEWCKRFQ